MIEVVVCTLFIEYVYLSFLRDILLFFSHAFASMNSDYITFYSPFSTFSHPQSQETSLVMIGPGWIT